MLEPMNPSAPVTRAVLFILLLKIYVWKPDAIG